MHDDWTDVTMRITGLLGEHGAIYPLFDSIEETAAASELAD